MKKRIAKITSTAMCLIMALSATTSVFAGSSENTKESPQNSAVQPTASVEGNSAIFAEHAEKYSVAMPEDSVITRLCDTGNLGADEIVSITKVSPLSHQRSFLYEFDLPAGYSIVEDYNYGGPNAPVDEPCGYIYVLDCNNEVVNVIEPIRVEDRFGDELPSGLVVDGSTLVLNVDVEDHTPVSFAIIMASHPNKVYTAVITKAKAISIRNEIKGYIDDIDNVNDAISFIISAAGFAVRNIYCFTIGGLSWISATTAAAKAQARYDMYANAIDNMNNGDSLEVTTTLKWQHHGGNDGTYRIYNEVLTIV